LTNMASVAECSSFTSIYLCQIAKGDGLM